jgi:hypothetical protein
VRASLPPCFQNPHSSSSSLPTLVFFPQDPDAEKKAAKAARKAEAAADSCAIDGGNKGFVGAKQSRRCVIQVSRGIRGSVA